MSWIACGPCRLDCPRGMARAEGFCGLAGTDDEISVIVQQLPVPASQVRPGLQPEQLERRGMFLLGQENAVIAGQPGLLLHVAQPRKDQTFVKWIGITGDEHRTVLITAAFPQQSSPTWSATLRNVVLTAQHAGGDDAAALPTEPVGTLKAEPPFAFACQLQGEAIYTPGGAFPLRDPADPLFMVARGRDAVPAADRAQYAEQRARLLEGASGLEIESSEAIVVDGLPGFQVMGETPAGPTALFVCQTVLFDELHYFLLVGLAAADVRHEYQAKFCRMTASFQRA